MRIAKHRKLEAVCAKDRNRPALLNPHFDGKKVTATDGRALIQFEPDWLEEGDTPGIIPLDLLKMSRAGDGVIALDKSLATTKTATGMVASMVRDDYVYPDIETYMKQQQIKPETKTIKIGLDAALLYALTQANGVKSGPAKHHIVLTISLDEADRLKAIPVKFMQCDDTAVLMPVRIPD